MKLCLITYYLLIICVITKSKFVSIHFELVFIMYYLITKQDILHLENKENYSQVQFRDYRMRHTKQTS